MVDRVDRVATNCALSSSNSGTFEPPQTAHGTGREQAVLVTALLCQPRAVGTGLGSAQALHRAGTCWEPPLIQTSSSAVCLDIALHVPGLLAFCHPEGS